MTGGHIISKYIQIVLLFIFASILFAIVFKEYTIPGRASFGDHVPSRLQLRSSLELEQLSSCDVFSGVLKAVDRQALNMAIGKALSHLPMAHPDLVAIAQKYLLEPPAPRSQLKLAEPARRYYSQFRQDEAVDKLLKAMTNGFFLEVGAFDGESLSNSLFFEKERNWTGLLVEPLPVPYSQLREKHRHAYTANVCLGTEQKSYITSFSNREMLSSINPDVNTHRGRLLETLNVLCVPLYSLLKAIGQKRVDYFSLDIESTDVELAVLKSLPWGEIEFGLIDIEIGLGNGVDVPGLERIRKFMDEKEFIEIMQDDIDSFFLNKTLASPDMPTRRKTPEILAK